MMYCDGSNFSFSESEISYSLNSEMQNNELKTAQKTRETKESIEMHCKNLLINSENFSRRHPFPLVENRLKTLLERGKPVKKIFQDAIETYPILHRKVFLLMENFLTEKRKRGTEKEKALYQEMNTTQLIDRLLKQRPLVFMTKIDYHLLRDGTKGEGGFELIGTEDEKTPLTLEEYISYDEMPLSAMIGISSPTYFINRGWRNNRGESSKVGTFEERGVYTAIVGARLEKPGFMEWKHMVITPEQNIPENGYGKEADPENSKTRSLKLWAEFYGCRNGELNFFPTYAEALNDTTGKYIRIGKDKFLNAEVYKKRMRMSIEPFLLDANERANREGKKAYVHAVGAGLGEWKLSELQGPLMVDVYSDIIKERDLRHISNINFSWFPKICTTCGGVGNEEVYETKYNQIKIHFSLKNPAEKLTGEEKEKLLVASFAWDGNSYPGNEYWLGSEYLAASGDPAAACCSTIQELQNPEINPSVSGSNIHIF